MRWLLILPALGVTCCQLRTNPQPGIAYSNHISDNCLKCATDYTHYQFSSLQQWQQFSPLSCTCSPSTPFQPPFYLSNPNLSLSSDITSELTNLHTIQNNVIVYLTASPPPTDFAFNQTTLYHQLIQKEKLLIILTPADPLTSTRRLLAAAAQPQLPQSFRALRQAQGYKLSATDQDTTDFTELPTVASTEPLHSTLYSSSTLPDDATDASSTEATSTYGSSTPATDHTTSTSSGDADGSISTELAEESTNEESEGTSEGTAEWATDSTSALPQANYVHDAWRNWLYSQGFDGAIMVNSWHSPDSSTSDILVKLTDQLKIASCGSVNSVNVHKRLDFTPAIWKNVSHLHIDVLFQREKVTGWNFLREGIEYLANDFRESSEGLVTSASLVNVGVGGKCERLELGVQEMQGWRKVSTSGDFRPSEVDWKESENEGDDLPDDCSSSSASLPAGGEWREDSSIVCDDGGTAARSVDVVGCLQKVYGREDGAAAIGGWSMRVVVIVVEDWMLGGDDSWSSSALAELLVEGVGSVYLIPLWPSVKSWQCGGREVMSGLSGWKEVKTVGFRRRKGAGLEEMVKAISEGLLARFPGRDFQQDTDSITPVPGRIIYIEVWSLGKYVGYLMMLIIGAAAIAASLILVMRFFVVRSEYRRFGSPDPPSGIQAPRRS